VHAWISSLVRGRLPEVALALALGSAAIAVAADLAEVAVRVIAQHAGSNSFDDVGSALDVFAEPYLLNFTIGSTVIVYGDVLVQVLALGLVAFAGALILRRRDHELGVCPYCASRIPYEATTCAYCGSAVEPSERPA
jgi:ribosomal protein L40E